MSPCAYAGLDHDSIPDEILINILTKIHANGAKDLQRRPTLQMLRTIGSVSRRMRRLCFEPQFWEGSDCLLCFKSPENTRQILAHIPDTKNITSIKLTNNVIRQASKYFAAQPEDQSLWQDNVKRWDRCVQGSLSCLVEVLKKCPSICTLSVALSQGHISEEFTSALSRVSLLTTLSIHCCRNGRIGDMDAISYSEFLSVIKNCQNTNKSLTSISLRFGHDSANSEYFTATDINFELLPIYCPRLQTLLLTSVRPYCFSHSLKSICALNSLPSITYLKLKNFNITNYHTLADLKNVNEIHVEHCRNDFLQDTRQSLHFVDSNIQVFTMKIDCFSPVTHFTFVRCHKLHTVVIDVYSTTHAGMRVTVHVEDCGSLVRLDTGEIDAELVTVERCPLATLGPFEIVMSGSAQDDVPESDEEPVGLSFDLSQ